MGGRRWTVEGIKVEALKYSTRTEFARSSGAYASAVNKGILDEVCSHMLAGRQPRYSLEDAKAAAALCKNQNEFKKKYPELHAFARRNKAMDYVCQGLQKKKVWSDVDLVAEASKYRTLGDFKKGSPYAYASLLRKSKKYLKADATRHMAPCKTEWTDEMLYAEAGKYATRIEFKTANYGAYQAVFSHGIADEAFRHMLKIHCAWDEQKVKREASRHSTRVEFINASPQAYSAARRLGVLDDVCSHMQPIFTHWSVDAVRVEAQKYTTRSEFASKAYSAYQAGRRLGVLDDVCSHMIPAFQWGVEELVAVVNNCSTLTELIKTRPEVYKALQSRGILREITFRLPRGRNGFKPDLVSDFYVYKISFRHAEFIGFGITNDMATRHRHHVRSITRHGGVSELLFSYKISGRRAASLERTLKQTLPIVDTGVPGFRTEATLYDEAHLVLIKQAVESVYNECNLAISTQTK